MKCFWLIQQSLESDPSLFGLTVTAINYIDVRAALSAATVIPVILLTALPGSVNFALSIIYIERKRLHIGKILLQRTQPIQSVCGLPYLDYWENLPLLLHLRPSLQMTTSCWITVRERGTSNSACAEERNEIRRSMVTVGQHYSRR